jgi:hypothetical protein
MTGPEHEQLGWIDQSQAAVHGGLHDPDFARPLQRLVNGRDGEAYLNFVCGRVALDLGVGFECRTFSALGSALLPLQFLGASAGLALVRLG